MKKLHVARGPTLPPVRKSVQPTKIQLSDIELTPEFQLALKLLEGSNTHLCITGKAGTGKSTLLRYFRETTKKNIAVIAPTGIAAINVGGQTVHSLLRFPPRFLERDDVRAAGKNRIIIQKLDTLIIDEVSMVRADLMDAIDWSLRVNRGQMGTPFGGVQMVFFGDLYQLPPVVDAEMRGIFEQRYESPFFFSADVFQSLELGYIELTRIFRQTDHEFVSLLNRIRDNECAAGDLNELNRRWVGGKVPTGEDAVTLTTTNRGAAEINQQRLSQLQEPQFEYEAAISGKFEGSAYPTDKALVLKAGAQVMLLRNDSGKRWVNGSIGHIACLSRNSVTVSMEGTHYAIPKERWEKIQYKWNAETEKIEREVIGVFEQYPIKLAWAITIHKSQGQTLTDVMIDMGSGAFAHGQLYVALSRCTSLAGIKLKTPIRQSDIIFDSRVLDFRNRVYAKPNGT